MKRLIGLLIAAALCSTAFATVTTKWQTFNNGIVVHALSAAVPACSTYAFSWGEAPWVSLSWNVYGDSGTIYRVGMQWADHLGHFDARIDTVFTDTLFADYTKGAARRITEEVARSVSQYGRMIFMRDTLSAAGSTANIDTTAVVVDQPK